MQKNIGIHQGMTIDFSGFDKMIKYQTENQEIVSHLREYVAVMRDEPAEQLIKFDSVYHDLNRILGNEV